MSGLHRQGWPSFALQRAQGCAAPWGPCRGAQRTPADSTVPTGNTSACAPGSSGPKPWCLQHENIHPRQLGSTRADPVPLQPFSIQPHKAKGTQRAMEASAEGGSGSWGAALPSVLLHARAPSIRTPCPACRGNWSTDGSLLLCLQILLYSLGIPLAQPESISAPGKRPWGTPLCSAAFLPRCRHPRLHQGSDAFPTLLRSAERTGEPGSGFNGRRMHVKAFSLKTGLVF